MLLIAVGATTTTAASTAAGRSRRLKLLACIEDKRSNDQQFLLLHGRRATTIQRDMNLQTILNNTYHTNKRHSIYSAHSGSCAIVTSSVRASESLPVHNDSMICGTVNRCSGARDSDKFTADNALSLSAIAELKPSNND